MQLNEYNLRVGKDCEKYHSLLLLLILLLLHIKCMFYLFNDVQQTEIETAEPIISEPIAVRV
jgi:hypothetical protein